MNIKEAAISFNGVFVPAEVFLNDNLSAKAKLLFGFIRNLSKSSKGCWASNRWLGQYLKINPTSVSALISDLQSEKCIRIELTKKPGFTNETERRIFVNNSYFSEREADVIAFNDSFLNQDYDEEISPTPLRNFNPPPYEKSEGGLRKNRRNKDYNLKDNNLNKPPYIPPPPVSVNRRNQSSRNEESGLLSNKKQDKYFIEQLPLPYQKDADFIRIWKIYIDSRKKTTSRAVQEIVHDIRHICRGDIKFAIECIKRSVTNCWTGVFFKKDEYQKQERQYPASEDGMCHGDPDRFAKIPVEVIYNDWEPKPKQEEPDRPRRRGSVR